MALIAMAVYDTEENKRSKITMECLDGIYQTVDLKKHRLIIVDNNSCENTKELFTRFSGRRFIEQVITLPDNIGTARAINQAWKLRQPGEHCIKMDNDIIINSPSWVDELEEAIRRDPTIGQVGLKRKDCWEWPGNPHPDWRSELHMLPHKPGEPWKIVEKVKHVIGSCVMHNAALLDKVGYLYQPSLYGYDDVIMSHRTHLAGFYSCFLSHINIDHIDPGDTPYQDWKEKHSGEQTQAVIKLVNAMERRETGLYFDTEGNQSFK
jgi:GT2 family glycosyltransferase